MALVIHTLNGVKKFIAWIFAKIIYLWGRSLRISIANNSLHILQEVQSQSKICATWHHNLLITPEVFRKFCHNTKMYGLISPSKDGSWGSYILNQFNINTIRGSSKRGGVSAFLSMQRALQNEICAVTFTPDGPRGPRCVLKNGMIKLAKISNVPIILMTAKFSHSISINSWDKMNIPLPFSKVLIEFHIIRTEEINNLSFDELKLKVQNLLN
jgi:lysophospholipid acyltransferase (LPLAT)-like uncharacterized protein